MRRRSFVGLTGAALLGAVLPPHRPDPASTVDLTDALLPTESPAAHQSNRDDLSLDRLRGAVRAAKQAYQASRYTQVARMIPGLLPALDAAASTHGGDLQLQAWGLMAQAYHVAASIGLKVGDEGPGWLAADRSLRAAERNGNSLMVASSARIVVHALAASGHHRHATELARRAATRLSQNAHLDDDKAVSVYGSLLLRGAIAAAHNQDRSETTELLDEADDASRRLGADHNHAWTAFGPTNVLLHRVHIATILGDAGTAIDHARHIEPTTIPLAERRTPNQPLPRHRHRLRTMGQI